MGRVVASLFVADVSSMKSIAGSSQVTSICVSADVRSILPDLLNSKLFFLIAKEYWDCPASWLFNFTFQPARSPGAYVADALSGSIVTSCAKVTPTFARRIAMRKKQQPLHDVYLF